MSSPIAICVSAPLSSLSGVSVGISYFAVALFDEPAAAFFAGCSWLRYFMLRATSNHGESREWKRARGWGKCWMLCYWYFNGMYSQNVSYLSFSTNPICDETARTRKWNNFQAIKKYFSTPWEASLLAIRRDLTSSRIERRSKSFNDGYACEMRPEKLWIFRMCGQATARVPCHFIFCQWWRKCV